MQVQFGGRSPQSGSWGWTAPRLAVAVCEEQQLGVLYIFVGKKNGRVLVGRSGRDRRVGWQSARTGSKPDAYEAATGGSTGERMDNTQV